MDERHPEPCARFEEALPALLGIDGDRLPPAEEEALLAHAAGCARCSQLRRSYAATVDLLRALPRKDAPADFLSWVRTEGRPPPPATRRSLRRPLWLAAAAVLVLGATTFLVLEWIGDRSGLEVAVREAEPEAEVTAAAPGGAIPKEEAPPEPQYSRKVETLGPLPVPEEPVPQIASPVGDGEAIGIVLDVRAPLSPERWADEVVRLEADLRARFEAPPEGARSAGAVALRSAGRSAEAPRREAVQEAAAPPPLERELQFEIDASSLPFLVERLERWARDAGGSLVVEGGAASFGKLAGTPAAAAVEPPAARLRVQIKLRPGAAAKSP